MLSYPIQIFAFLPNTNKIFVLGNREGVEKNKRLKEFKYFGDYMIFDILLNLSNLTEEKINFDKTF